MKPITFTCAQTMAITPKEITRQILDLARWPEFQGYGVLPGIKTADFLVQTPEVVGTRIGVTNSDGSSHVEEIVEWDPTRRLQMRMEGFSPPLSRLATRFDETWEFERTGEQTRVVRSFAMHARSVWTRPILAAISVLLKRAIARHLRQMRDAVPKF